MGSFYVNHTVRAADREKIASVLAGRDAFISPVKGDVVVVYDRESDSQDADVIADLAKDLSERLATVVLAVLNHDDDILAYWLFDRGGELDTYDSTPGYFEDLGDAKGPSGGNAKVLCRSFGSAEAAEVETILRKDDYTFAMDRHTELFAMLGLEGEIFLAGYRYLEEGEFPDGLEKSDFIEIRSDAVQ